MSDPVFPLRLSEQEEFGIALTLAKVSHFVHPQIVEAIQRINESDADRLADIIPQKVDGARFLYPGSACVFPGVRRFVGRLNKKELLKYVPAKRTIIDDNRLPRHLWTFLAAGVAYSGPSWKTTGLGEFELAHIFAHKSDERKVEQNVFEHVDETVSPDGLFTCASNVVLVPKGLAKPTDHLKSVKRAFFKRYVSLYGEEILPGISELKDTEIPSWYSRLEWSEPVLPDGWKQNLEKLREYRFRRLRGLFAKPLAE